MSWPNWFSKRECDVADAMTPTKDYVFMWPADTDEVNIAVDPKIYRRVLIDLTNNTSTGIILNMATPVSFAIVNEGSEALSLQCAYVLKSLKCTYTGRFYAKYNAGGAWTKFENYKIGLQEGNQPLLFVVNKTEVNDLKIGCDVSNGVVTIDYVAHAER